MVICEFLGVSVCEEQDEEMASLINSIDESKVGQATLNTIFTEAEKESKGGDQLLHSIRNAEKEMASFFKDQANNSKGIAESVE